MRREQPRCASWGYDGHSSVETKPAGDASTVITGAQWEPQRITAAIMDDESAGTRACVGAVETLAPPEMLEQGPLWLLADATVWL